MSGTLTVKVISRRGRAGRLVGAMGVGDGGAVGVAREAVAGAAVGVSAGVGVGRDSKSEAGAWVGSGLSRVPAAAAGT